MDSDTGLNDGEIRWTVPEISRLATLSSLYLAKQAKGRGEMKQKKCVWVGTSESPDANKTSTIVLQDGLIPA